MVSKKYSVGLATIFGLSLVMLEVSPTKLLKFGIFSTPLGDLFANKFVFPIKYQQFLLPLLYSNGIQGIFAAPQQPLSIEIN